jgi:hypothetical protein
MHRLCIHKIKLSMVNAQTTHSQNWKIKLSVVKCTDWAFLTLPIPGIWPSVISGSFE